MKVEIKENETKKERVFPKLMIDKSGIIILFIDNKKGIVLQSGGFFEFGEYDDNWSMIGYSDFEGSITITNI